MRNRCLSLAAIGAALLTFGGCGAGSGDDAAGTTGAAAGPDVVFIPKVVNVDYFDTAAAGAREAAAELGGRFEMVGPSDATAASQVPFINTQAQKHAGVIAISGNDANAVAPALKQAAAAGSKVMSWDSDVAPDARSVYVADITAEAEAQNQLDMLGEQMDYRGEFAILSSSPTATAQNEWIAAMKELLRTPRYSGMKLVKIAYGEENDQKTLQEAQGLLRAYPNLRGITGIFSIAPMAIARAVERADKVGDVAVTGVALPSALASYLKRGTIERASLWDVTDLGYLTYYAAAALARGDITGRAGETFRAGRMGEREVGEDGQIVLGPPLVLTKDNVGDYDF
ncbi:substrate-binding domain-containing protein [Conexibacter sp. CPCC 206217]|uniref:substrate-binding domain-containing protein n=1 Tax=Conexibacter sp. CPCC 206217 TaxID=3064574 RepID=UPI00271B1181|nr:substrate-binding domain-containing protein [Conexibacter sp. CPCC 206217]MDO8208777.1 substrate-binding domain-containing protein [Conexibacter sp. CPCC 206217]